MIHYVLFFYLLVYLSVLVPSSVRDVVILVETPERVNVTWIVPAEPHDDPTNIQSIVEWSTNNVDGTSTHGRTDKNCVTKIQDRGGLDTYSCRVQKLNASQLYQFKVIYLHCPPLPLSQQTRDIHPMLFQCWPTVFDAGPTLIQH